MSHTRCAAQGSTVSRIVGSATGAACTVPYLLYVAAIVPSGATTVLGGTYLLDSRKNWSYYTGGPLPPYLCFFERQRYGYLPILDQLDLASLMGTRILVGYGTSDTEMLAAGRYWEIYTVK